MSLTALCSASGAPGCTTLACLLGAVWPLGDAVVVAECDPNGGAVAARFDLDTQVGMTSFVLANRHTDTAVPVEPHLQRLPGGLEVLVGAAGPEAARLVDAETPGMAALAALPCHVVADCGRVLHTAPGQHWLLARADVVIVVASDDRASVANAAAMTARWRDAVTGRLGVAVLARRGGEARRAADALDLELAVTVPVDPSAAAIVRGEPGRQRRLLRSALVGAATRLQSWVGPGTLPRPRPPMSGAATAGPDR